MAQAAKYVIVTPYYKEERRLLERCLASVRSQTVRTDHLLVADGFPQDWIDAAGVRHLKLDRNHGDCGNTPRGVGALLAVAEEYSGIGFLDADNWLEPDHVEVCLAAASALSAPCDFVIARRTFRRLDESVMPVADEPQHVDTNCYFLLPGAFNVVPHWAMMPKRMAPGGDRVFLTALLARDLVAAQTSKPTVNYQSLWRYHYRVLGETPPPDAKTGVNHGELKEWFDSLAPRENVIARRLMGWPVATDNGASTAPTPALAQRRTSGAASQHRVGRNDKCPCGSGRKYKHCHGARSVT